MRKSFCSKCGEALQPEDQFCGACGAGLNPLSESETDNNGKSSQKSSDQPVRQKNTPDSSSGKSTKQDKKNRHQPAQSENLPDQELGIMDGVRFIFGLIGAGIAFSPMLYLGPWLMKAARTEATGYLANAVIGVFFLALALLAFMVILSPTLNKWPDSSSSRQRRRNKPH